MSKLTQLLDKLRERQSWCPYCGAEYLCNAGCILEGFWFEEDVDPQPTHSFYCKSDDPESCTGDCW